MRNLFITRHITTNLTSITQRLMPKLVWALLGVSCLLIAFLQLTYQKAPLDLELDSMLLEQLAFVPDVYWKKTVYQFHLVGFDDRLINLFSSHEWFVLSGLQWLFRGLIVSLWVILLVMIVSQFRQNWRHLLFGFLFLMMLIQTDLWFALYQERATYHQELFKIAFMGLLLLLVKSKLTLPTHSQKRCLLAYASQTGSARQLANRLHHQVSSEYDLCSLDQITPIALLDYDQILFIVSTYGEGEPPDTARTFRRQLDALNLAALQTDALLKNTSEMPQFSVLALGDRHYASFCAFGHYLDQRLEQLGFRKMQAVVEVNQMDMNTVNRWWRSLPIKSQVSEITLPYTELTLNSIHCFNPEQAHRQAYHLSFSGPELVYQPGDLLAVYPKINQGQLRQRMDCLGWSVETIVVYQQQAMKLIDVLQTLDWTDEQADDPQTLVDLLKPIHERLYSIASYAQGRVDLLVRKHLREDGSIGNASGFLCGLTRGDQIQAQIRSHTSFHLKNDSPIIMIAAGTGLAPFIGFLEQKRASLSQQKTWLMFGEQYQAHDAYFAEKLETFQQEKVLTRLDCVWSRDTGQYVQQHLLAQQQELKRWIEEGAEVYVCGSLSGFGQAVMETLHRLLPQKVVEHSVHTDLY